MFERNKPVTVLHQSLIEELAAGPFGQRPPPAHPLWTWAEKRADALVAEAESAARAPIDVCQRNGDRAETQRSDRAFYQMLDERFGNS